MKDTDHTKLIELCYMGGGFIPHNERAEEMASMCAKGQVVSFMECTARDLKFHRCYMSLLGFIYAYLPASFKDKVSKNDFYKLLKSLQGKYKVLFSFQDGTKLVEYESIAFGNMSDVRFKEYIREQLPFIYTEVIGKFFEGDLYDNIISTIEEQYEKFMTKLFK